MGSTLIQLKANKSKSLKVIKEKLCSFQLVISAKQEHGKHKKPGTCCFISIFP